MAAGQREDDDVVPLAMPGERAKRSRAGTKADPLDAALLDGIVRQLHGHWSPGPRMTKQLGFLPCFLGLSVC
jgi:hypothetical protein